MITRIQHGESILRISAETDIASSTLYKWVKQVELPGPARNQKITMREINSLRRKGEKYKHMVSILQSANCTVASLRKDKLAALETLYGHYDVYTLCEALDVPRGTFYNYILRGKHGDTLNACRREELRGSVLKVFNENHQLFGAGKITAILREKGFITTEKLVAELMHEMGLQSVSAASKRTYQKWQRGENKNILQQRFHVE